MTDRLSEEVSRIVCIYGIWPVIQQLQPSQANTKINEQIQIQNYSTITP